MKKILFLLAVMLILLVRAGYAEDGVSKQAYKVLECEENNAVIMYNGNNVAESCVYENDDASNKKFLRTNLSEITWSFIADRTGYYDFEILATGDSVAGNSQFYVNDSLIFNGTLNSGESWGVNTVQSTSFGRVYLLKHTQYTLKLVQNNGTAVMDYFNVYYEDIYEAESGKTAALTSVHTGGGNDVAGEDKEGAHNGKVYTILDGGNVRVTANIEKSGFYNISVCGFSYVNVNSRIRIDEITSYGNDSSRVVITPKLVPLPSTNGAQGYNDGVATVYLSEGEKIITLIVSGGAYICDYISLTPVDVPLSRDKNIIEAEFYEKSNDKNCTKAFSSFYDASNKMAKSGVMGSNLNIDYKFYIEESANYDFSLYGSANSYASRVSIAVDIDYEPISAIVETGAWQDTETQIGTLWLEKGYHTFKLTCDNKITFDAMRIKKQVEFMREIIVNAETDFDRYAGHNIGWYDNTPDGYDDQIRDKYGYVDVYANGDYYNNNIGQAAAYMTSNEWFRYTVEVAQSGYYRLLLGIKVISKQNNGNNCKFTIDVNGNKISKTIAERQDFWTSNPLPWDDFGLVYLNEGSNVIKVIFDNASGYAQFDAFKLVYPEFSTYIVEDSGTDIIEAEDYTDTDASYKLEEHIVLTPGNYVVFDYDAPKDGKYVITAVANGDGANATANPRVYIYDNNSLVTTANVSTSGSWDPINKPVQTKLASIKLTHGNHKIKLVVAEGFSIAFDKLIIDIPDEKTKVETITTGYYSIIANLDNWYLGYTKTDNSQKIYWNSEEYIDTLAVIAAVFDGAEFKSAKMCKQVDDGNLAVIDDVYIEEGNTVKVYIWDLEGVKPLGNFMSK